VLLTKTLIVCSWAHLPSTVLRMPNAA
jgi:hypothetical protein